MTKSQKYQQKFQEIIYGKAVHRFEDRLLLLTTLSITAILIVSTYFNWAIGLKSSLVISSAAGCFLYFTLYLFGRFINRSGLFYWITSIISLLYIDVIWFFNFASQGPTMPLLLVLYAFFILIFNKKYILTISVLLFGNLFGLLLVELFFSDAIGSYTDINSRVYDNYIGMVFSFLVIYAFIAAIKRNYVHEYERAKMSDHLKSAFVANMSHEIRTPLNAIVGFSSLMTDPDIGEEDKQAFEKQILDNSDYLLSLIEDIIDVSKIESNQLTVKLQDVDVVPLIRQITQSFQMSVPYGKKIKVISSLNMPELIVRVDRVRLEQILRNLLSNAVKFTDEGVIEVKCQKDSDFYIFAVKDSGIGIHTDHQQVIFDRFMKIDNNKQQLYRGTGIGLFLSRQLVEIFGGKIWVESEVGKGSNFYFTIPV
jgi:signal transduction histidine kinase